MMGNEDFHEVIRRMVFGRRDPRHGNFTEQLNSKRETNTLVDPFTGQDCDRVFDACLYQPRMLGHRHRSDVTMSGHKAAH